MNSDFYQIETVFLNRWVAGTFLDQEIYVIMYNSDIWVANFVLWIANYKTMF